MADKHVPLVMEEVTDPEELAKAVAPHLRILLANWLE